MGLLYPRLLAGQAKPLHQAQLRLSLAELTAGAATDHPSAVYVATGGDRVGEARLKELRAFVTELAADAGFPSAASRESHADFDLKLAAGLHSEMGLVPAEAASRDVWAFLALVLLPDVAYWRYPNRTGDRVLGTDITRHVFGRLWWRAQLVHSPESDEPYGALRVLGESAFDQLYGRRTSLGGSPHLVKGILRVWNELDTSRFNEREVLRDFLKRLRRLEAFILFDALDDEALNIELGAIVQESVAAFARNAPSASGGPTAAVEPVAHADTSDGSAAIQPSGRTTQESTAPTVDVVPAPYTAYEGPPFDDPRLLSIQEAADAVAAVVAVEGPVKAARVYHVITRLAGTRLNESAENRLVQATKYAVQTGRIEAENQRGRSGYPASTLRLPEQPAWMLRDRGPRDIDEIPERELAEAVNLIVRNESNPDFNMISKHALSLFGFKKSTERFQEALARAIRKSRP
jgi:hypothetical protein